MLGARLSLGRTAAISVAAAIFVCGCSPGQSDAPTEAAARTFYEGQFKELITPGILKLASFKKTNGIKRAEGGEEGYDLEYEAELEFPKGWLPQCVDMKHFEIGRAHV